MNPWQNPDVLLAVSRHLDFVSRTCCERVCRSWLETLRAAPPSAKPTAIYALLKINFVDEPNVQPTANLAQVGVVTVVNASYSSIDTPYHEIERLVAQVPAIGLSVDNGPLVLTPILRRELAKRIRALEICNNSDPRMLATLRDLPNLNFLTLHRVEFDVPQLAGLPISHLLVSDLVFNCDNAIGLIQNCPRLTRLDMLRAGIATSGSTFFDVCAAMEVRGRHTQPAMLGLIDSHVDLAAVHLPGSHISFTFFDGHYQAKCDWNNLSVRVILRNSYTDTQMLPLGFPSIF